MSLTLENRAEQIAELGLTVDSVFVPYSKSRNKAKKHKSLNWIVTVKLNGREVLLTNYSAGIAYCPGYNRKVSAYWNRTVKTWQDAICKFECESGFQASSFTSWGGFSADKSKPIKPNALDVIYSLTMDSDVLNYSKFKDWTEAFGYNPDSRDDEKAYRVCYRACRGIALRMRAALGESGLLRLNEIFQGY